MANTRPNDEQTRLWRTWYENAVDPYLPCACCGERIDLRRALWGSVKYGGSWYATIQCTNRFCSTCGGPGGGMGSCREGAALPVPVPKPVQKPGTDYSTYNNTAFPLPDGDDWRTAASVLPKFDGIYESESASFMGVKTGNLFLRFAENGQVFSAYSVRKAAEVATWLGRPGIDYEATGLSFSTGLYSMRKRKITIALPTKPGGGALTAVATGKIGRFGGQISTVTPGTRKGQPIKHAYTFRRIKGM